MEDHTLSSEGLIEAVTNEKAIRIKKLIEKNFNEDFIMELYDLNPEEYQKMYNRLYPYGRFTGPFGELQEKELKTRMIEELKMRRTLEEKE